MSPFFPTHDAARGNSWASGESRADGATTPAARPVTGPVLLGDIHTAPDGRPLLLTLWARWEARAKGD